MEMGVPQFTTPTFTLTFTEQGLDLTTQAMNVYVTFESGNYELTKSGESLDIGEKTISVFLEQEETGNFSPSLPLKIQANWTTLNGHRVASEVAMYDIDEQLLKGVII